MAVCCLGSKVRRNFSEVQIHRENIVEYDKESFKKSTTISGSRGKMKRKSRTDDWKPQGIWNDGTKEEWQEVRSDDLKFEGGRRFLKYWRTRTHLSHEHFCFVLMKFARWRTKEVRDIEKTINKGIAFTRHTGNLGRAEREIGDWSCCQKHRVVWLVVWGNDG